MQSPSPAHSPHQRSEASRVSDVTSTRYPALRRPSAYGHAADVQFRDGLDLRRAPLRAVFEGSCSKLPYAALRKSLSATPPTRWAFAP
jgi:hypothetical protein